MGLLSEANKADRTLHYESVRAHSERNGSKQAHEVVGNITLQYCSSVYLVGLFLEVDRICYIRKRVTLHLSSPNPGFCGLSDLPNCMGARQPQILASLLDSLRSRRLRFLHICRNNPSLKPRPSPHSVGRRAFCFNPIFFTLLCDRRLLGIRIWQKKRIQTTNLLSVLRALLMLRSKFRFFGIVVAELRVLNYGLTFGQCALRSHDESTYLSLSVLSGFSMQRFNSLF